MSAHAVEMYREIENYNSVSGWMNDDRLPNIDPRKLWGRGVGDLIVLEDGSQWKIDLMPHRFDCHVYLHNTRSYRTGRALVC